MEIDIFGDSEINFRSLTKVQLIRCLGVTSETIDTWVDNGAPIEPNKMFDSEKIFKWRLQREIDKNRDGELGEDEIGFSELKRLDLLESYRKKKIENDLAEKKIYNAEEVDSKFYDLASGIKSAMLNIVPRVSHSLVKKDRFQIERILTKEISDSLNQYGDKA